MAADDDMPLAALAKAKAPKFDDDTPLASLASLSKKAPGRSPGEKRGRPSGPAKPGAAAPPRGSPPKARPSTAGKKKGDSDSDSSSSSDSSDSSSDDKPMKKKAKGKGKGAARRKSVQSSKKEGDEEGGGSDEEEQGPVKKRDRSVKEGVVAELLSRWWYALPEWPPVEESYYEEQLKKRGLRKVTIQEWEWVDDVDKNGLKKVYALSAFRGMVRDGAGELIDLRPTDTCPCQNNMMKKDLAELYRLLVKAYETQLEELKKSRYDETQLRLQLQGSLTRARDKSYKANNLTGSTRKTAGQ